MIDMETVQYRILSYMSEDESFKNLSLKDSMRLVRIFQETLVHVEMEDHRRREQEKYGWDMLLFEEEDPDAAEKAREAEAAKEREKRDRMFAEQRDAAKTVEDFYRYQEMLKPMLPEEAIKKAFDEDPLKIYRLKKEDPPC